MYSEARQDEWAFDRRKVCACYVGDAVSALSKTAPCANTRIIGIIMIRTIFTYLGRECASSRNLLRTISPRVRHSARCIYLCAFRLGKLAICAIVHVCYLKANGTLGKYCVHVMGVCVRVLLVTCRLSRAESIAQSGSSPVPQPTCCVGGVTFPRAVRPTARPSHWNRVCVCLCVDNA